MTIPFEMLELMKNFPEDMEKNIIEAYLNNRSVESIVAVAQSKLKEGEVSETGEH
ncbi:hypothetical protein [Paenibacillus sp. MMS18-CY102]|uniref:hypothetical protein n=1 Tax=Paenibacillus sp. MMS18-CY102 TaxID=2682849 RepID=UPI001365C716|nr:hypothetical protein [Paenibacillus sp. MMS18-CY102]MWC28084.1 hypothetical protein [Paenibacillus sp. MMS18-CY102]